MKEWTRKRKADVCMGILLQIYFFFPWIRIDGGYHTIHVYLIEIFRKESCIKAYNYIFLSGHPILWKYSGFAAVTFTMIIAFMIVMQMIELWQLYRHMKGIKTFVYTGMSGFLPSFFFSYILMLHTSIWMTVRCSSLESICIW